MRKRLLQFSAFICPWLLGGLGSFFLAACSQWSHKVGQAKRQVKERPLIHSLYRVAWSKNLDPIYNTGNFPISINAPLIHDGLLFIGSLDGNFYAFHAETGKEIWSSKETTAIIGRPEIMEENVIYGTEEGRVIVRQFRNGTLLYQVDLGEAIESRPVFHQGRVLLHLRNHKIFCLDATTGKILWNYARSISQSPTLHGTSRPFIHDQKVIVGMADGVLVALNLEDGNIIWEQKLGANQGKFVDIDLTPSLHHGVLYASSFSGPLTLISPDSGNIIVKLPLTPSRSPIMTVDKEFLLLGTVNGTIHQLNRNHEILAEKKLTEGGLVSMALWKNHLVVATTRGRLLFLDPNSLDIVDTFPLGGPISTVFGAMEVEGGLLAILTSRNRLYIFK